MASSNQASDYYLYLRTDVEEFNVETYSLNKFGLKSPHPALAPTFTLMEYNTRNSPTINLSAVDVLLMSLQTPRKLAKAELDEKTRTALSELRPFKGIFTNKLCTGRR